VSSPEISFELEIRALAAGGDGVGRAPDGRVVFVPDTAPGDQVRVRVVDLKKRFARARVEELLTPGSVRTDPVCPVFGSCGGCAWQHVGYAAQLDAKAALLKDALRRIGGLVLPSEVHVEPSPSPYGYRGRARLHVAGGRVGFRRRRSRAICATRRCPILLPALDGALHELADRAHAEDGEWELAGTPSGEVRVDPPGGGQGALELEIGSDRLRFSSGVFVQSNTLLLPRLVEVVLEAVGQGEVAFELYAGAGTFTLGLARRFGRVVAVEGQAAAAQDLRRNLEAHGLGGAGVEVVEAPVERALAGTKLPEHADLALLDPPRTGLPPDGVELLAGRAPRRIAFLSCDPATLARDLSRLCTGGYRLEAIRGFDLFPQTPHVEALAILARV
jgi:23S rRNA (uracil1939-C5)-methyltransferase